MKEDKRETGDNAIYMKINSELKKQFNIKCLQENTTMTEFILNSIKKYIQE